MPPSSRPPPCPAPNAKPSRCSSIPFASAPASPGRSRAANPGAGQPVVTIARAPRRHCPPKATACAPSITAARAGVEIIGNDERGVLFGVGGLLRALEMRRDSVTLPGTLDIRTAPKYALRGHQLGYRPKTNSYDALERAACGKATSATWPSSAPTPSN